MDKAERRLKYDLKMSKKRRDLSRSQKKHARRASRLQETIEKVKPVPIPVPVKQLSGSGEYLSKCVGCLQDFHSRFDPNINPKPLCPKCWIVEQDMLAAYSLNVQNTIWKERNLEIIKG